MKNKKNSAQSQSEEIAIVIYQILTKITKECKSIVFEDAVSVSEDGRELLSEIQVSFKYDKKNITEKTIDFLKEFSNIHNQYCNNTIPKNVYDKTILDIADKYMKQS